MSQNGGARKGAGKKKGSTNVVTTQLRFDILATLRTHGIDPLTMVLKNYELCEELLTEAREGYENEFSPVKKVNHWLVNSRLQMLQQASFELMKYVYPQRKAIELTGAGGEDLFRSFAEMVKQVHKEAKDANAIEVPSERVE